MKTPSGQYTDEEMLNAMRAAAGSSGLVTRRAYDEYRSIYPDIPRSAAIAKRFRGWMLAEAFAGIVAPDAEPMFPIDLVDPQFDGMGLGRTSEEEMNRLVALAVARDLRDGPIEDVHAGDGLAAITDSQMLLLNLGNTHLISTALSRRGGDLRLALVDLRPVVCDADRPLPWGRTIGEVCGPLTGAVIDQAESVFAGSIQAVAGYHDDDAGRRVMALRGAVRGRHWWGTPWWTEIVDASVAEAAERGAALDTRMLDIYRNRPWTLTLDQADVIVHSLPGWVAVDRPTTWLARQTQLADDDGPREAWHK
jgi:hypothetical protein